MAAIDFLDRDKFIDDLISLFIQPYSKREENISFAITGAWGTGKTFVLEKLEKQLNEKDDRLSYLVFHYNCWEYDYYEEPLIAIVVAMLNFAKEENSLFSKKIDDLLRDIGLTSVTEIKKVLTEIFPIASIPVEIVKEYRGTKEKRIKKETGFDKYYSFKQALNNIQNLLNKFTDKYTLIFVIDELDRCIPPYAIKVLERIHHLSIGLNNCQFIYSVDKEQLDETIKKLYGEKVKTESYLRKFIDFEIPLPETEATDSVCEKYKSFLKNFKSFENIKIQEKIVSFYNGVFKNIDIRTQKSIFEKVKFIHGLIFDKEKLDVSVLFFELFLTVMNQVYVTEFSHVKIRLSNSNKIIQDIGREFFKSFKYKSEYRQIDLVSNNPEISKIGCYEFIIKFISDVNLDTHNIFPDDKFYFNEITTNSLFFYYLYKIFKIDQVEFSFKESVEKRINNLNTIVTNLKKFDEILRMLK